MIAFGTVVYPKSLIYFNEFIDSLNSQSEKEFELVIINDCVDEIILSKYLSGLRVKYKVFNYYGEHTPTDLRVDLLKIVKDRGYELLIIGDSDDVFDKDRIAEIKKCFETNTDYTFFYNELLLFNKSKALKDVPLITNRIDQLLEYNYIGLSNSAINLSYVSEEFIESLYGCTSFVFDWYLFSRILCNGGKGRYVEKAITYYRIYENNYAGVSSERQLEKEFEVKKKHYELMSKYDSVYSTLWEKLLCVDISKVVNCSSLSYWWNNIKLGGDNHGF